MTEQTRSFNREAFSAAGPVFLVSIGVLLLALLGVLLLLGGLPFGVGAAFGSAGILSLVLGVAWGSTKREKRRRVQV